MHARPSLGISLWFSLAALAAGCSDSASAPPPPTQDQSIAFLTAARVNTLDGSSTLIASTAALPSGPLDLTTAKETPGSAYVQTQDNNVYISTTNGTITHYVLGDTLAAKEVINLSDHGVTTLDKSMFLDANRAFLVNFAKLEIIEWNPTTMTVTTATPITALQRPDWNYEYRGSFLRPADRTIFSYWVYDNNRVTFLNHFIVTAYQIDTGVLKILEDDTCSATGGYGGFFDEQGDLYLIADNFGGFTRFGGFPDPKDTCVRRIRAGETTFDPDYRFVPTQAMGGLEPWGLYYAGNGIAYTTAVDPTKLGNYSSVYEFVLAPIHEGYTLDIRAQTAAKLDGVPPDGVGLESVSLDGELLVPRTTGKVDLYDVANVETTVYRLNSVTRTAVPQFSMPGYLGNVIHVRQ